MDYFNTESFQTRAERDARWEELMLVKPNVVRDTVSVSGIGWSVQGKHNLGHMEYRVYFPSK
jgi:hypothetical protein